MTGVHPTPATLPTVAALQADDELTPWADGAGIGARIDAARGELTPQEQRVAEFLLQHLDDLALYSATEVAEGSGVSKATVSRLLRRLGYRDSQEFREETRSLRARGVPVRAAAEVAAEVSPFAAHFAAERELLDRLERTLDPALVARAAQLLSTARSVTVLGMRNSQPVALHLREQLLQSRPAVLLAPVSGQSLAEELAGLGPRDAVVLVAVRRRSAGVREVIDAITARRIPLVLLADASARHLARGVELSFEVPLGSPGAFDSYSAVMSLVAVLADAVLEASGSEGEERIEQIVALHDELGELERR